MDGNYYTYSGDIWSIGLVVYEMATGQHAYPVTSNPLELLHYIKTLQSPSLAQVPGLSSELADFVSHW